MTFWDINKAILEKQYAGLLEEILRQDDIDSSDIQVETAASGDLTLKFKGIHIHSQREPQREGRRLAESINAPAQPAQPAQPAPSAAEYQTRKNQNTPIVILGFGLGYTAQAAAELWQERPLIIIEKYMTVMRIALEQRNLQTLLARPNVVFICGGTGDGVAEALALFEDADGQRTAPAVIRNRSLTGMDEKWYSGVESRIRAWTMRDDVNSATLKRFGKRWVRNLSRNMEFIRDRPGISRLAGLAAAENNLPVFLAAAGPGLDSIGTLLHEIAERCIVVAVDTSLRFLLDRGISPDFALIVDPQFWNSRHLDRLAVEKTRLIAESAVYPPALKLPFRGIYLCGSLFPLGTFIEQRVDPKGSLGAGGSVATTAWDFCRTLGPQEIWIAGLDLAFTGLKTHFRGAAFEEKSHAQSCRLNPSETWLIRALRDGLPFRAPARIRADAKTESTGQAGPDTTVLTDRRLSLYATWFENRFSQHPNIRNYSLSEGGLAIKGLENVLPEKLLALPPRRNEIDAALNAACSRIEADFFATENKRLRAERYEAAVSSLTQGLAEIKASAENGADIAKQALRCKQDQGAQEMTLKRLDGISRAITHSEVKEVAGFLFPPVEANAGNSSGDPFIAYLKSLERLYSSLAEAVEINVKALKRTPIPFLSAMHRYSES